MFVKSWSTSGDADDRPIEKVSFVYSGLEEFSENSTTSLDLIEPKEKTSSEKIDPKKGVMREELDTKPKSKIPEWVQSTAKFWIDRNVSDEEFTNALGFLVKEKIIEVEVESQERNPGQPAEGSKVPDWIAQSTDWWINDQIPEDQFLEGIKWMIKNQIIRGV